MTDLRWQRLPSRVALVVLLCLQTACYRAVYTEIVPPGAATAPIAPTRRSAGWRNFYLYGYLPAELSVDAGAECGGAGRVLEIRTRQTFTQGLIRTFANSSGVNAYAPWTGEVVCIGDPAD